MVKEFCDRLEREQADWFSAFTFYQFRDRGRLGLEIENPNNPDTGIAQPVLDTYKEIIHRDWFSPQITKMEAMYSSRSHYAGATQKMPRALRFAAL